MAIVKYKVIGSSTDRFYHSKIIDVDDSVHITEEEQIDYVSENVGSNPSIFDNGDWLDEGSEPESYFSIDEIIKL